MIKRVAVKQFFLFKYLGTLADENCSAACKYGQKSNKLKQDSQQQKSSM